MNKFNADDLCAEVAAHVFSRTFAQKFFKIENPHSKLPVIFENDAIKISDLEIAADLLKAFGRLITKLALHFEYQLKTCSPSEKEQVRQILNYVNDYTRNSLVVFEIHFSGCNVDIFSEINNPFRNAKNVSFHITQNVGNSNDTRLNHTFPRVEHLDLDLEKVMDIQFINGTFKKLKQVHITPALFDKSVEAGFTNFIQMNPNITHLTIVSPTKKALLIINTYQKNLEELQILRELREGPSCVNYHFLSIKRLILRFSAGKCFPPKKTLFGPSLQDITLSCGAKDVSEDYFSFLYTYPQIKKLSAGVGLNDTSLQKLIGKLPNLSEATFYFGGDVTLDNIIHFIANTSKTLNILTFYHPSISNADQSKQRLDERFGLVFKIQFQIVGEFIEFVVERKIPIKNCCASICPALYGIFTLMLMYFVHAFSS